MTIKVNTQGDGGKKLKKKITVWTNDPERPQLQMVVTGLVERFARIVPSRILLRGHSAEALQAQVKILLEPKYPFKIADIETLHKDNIRYKLEKIKVPQGSGYILTVENLKKEPGKYYDVISLKTDSDLRPVIKISVFGTILDPKASGK